MNKILISACLLGYRVRYDAQSKNLRDKRLDIWQKQGRLVAICPEVAGGLSVPRPAAEIQSNGLVLSQTGEDVSQAFLLGAQRALDLAQEQQCRFALLKARSPSCGSGFTYDGSFKARLIERDGLSAKLLKEKGIAVFTDLQLDELELCLMQDEQ